MSIYQPHILARKRIEIIVVLNQLLPYYIQYNNIGVSECIPYNLRYCLVHLVNLYIQPFARRYVNGLFIMTKVAKCCVSPSALGDGA